MKPTRDEVRQAVFTAIRALLAPGTALQEDEALSPMDDLDLDSEDGLDFAETTSDQLDIEIPPDVNPFKDDVTQRKRTIREIVDLLIAFSDAASEGAA